MKITAVDHKLDLFLVENALPNFLVNRLSISKIINYKFSEATISGKYKRRTVDLPFFEDFLIDRYSRYFTRHFSKLLNQPLICNSYNLWIDEPNFIMTSHVDSDGDPKHVGLQIYLHDSNFDIGTCFYNHDKIRYEFPFKKNTGYLMVNGSDQIHSTKSAVPPDYYRVSLYFWFAKVDLS